MIWVLGSGVASPGGGGGERPLPFLPDFSSFFPDFSLFYPIFWQLFRCQEGTAPLTPQWLRHWFWAKMTFYASSYAIVHHAFVRILNSRMMGGGFSFQVHRGVVTTPFVNRVTEERLGKTNGSQLAKMKKTIPDMIPAMKLRMMGGGGLQFSSSQGSGNHPLGKPCYRRKAW